MKQITSSVKTYICVLNTESYKKKETRQDEEATVTSYVPLFPNLCRAYVI